MKKIIGLTLAALLVLAMVGGGTWAYFSDTETSTNNTLTAGTLDLNINGGNTAVTTFTASNVYPGQSDNGSSTLKNVGTLPGTLSVSTSNVTHSAGTNPGDSDIVPTDSLYTTAMMAIYVDVNGNGSWDTNDIGLKSDGTKYTNSGATALDYAAINSYSNQTWSTIETLAAGTSPTQKFTVNWTVPTGATNAIQGGSASVDFTFTLAQ